MEAFEHIRNKIDQIYKELTRSENFKQGGSAYLTLEDSDVIAFFRTI
jgi:chromosome segregation ATPase